MHCPQCGQQQVSDEMRFCSRCGFPLGVVTELLSKGGILPEREAESAAGKLAARRRGKRLGLLFLLTGMLLAVIAGLINTKNTNPLDAPGWTLLLFSPAIICVVIGFFRLLYALLLEGDVQTGKEFPLSQGTLIENANLDDARSYPVLPASHSVPVTGVGTKRIKTTEMVNVPSVTENTTKLLDEQS